MSSRELERLKIVNRFLVPQLNNEKELQDIVDLAAKVCETPTALITLTGQDSQHIRIKKNFDYKLKNDVFFNHLINDDQVIEVPDTFCDQRFLDNPMVKERPNIRFYASAPLITNDGHYLGSLCVINYIPGSINTLQKNILVSLSHQVIQLFEFEIGISVCKQQIRTASRAEIEMRSFFESSIDAHLLLGEKFEVLAFNKSLAILIEQKFGRKLIRDADMWQFLDPAMADVFYANYCEALNGTVVSEERSVEYQGSKVWWFIKYEPALDDRDQIIGVSVNSSNITKSVLQQQQVLAQTHSLEEIAFIQSHELRRPVALILGLMEVLKANEHIGRIKELAMMEIAVKELDTKIKLIVEHVSNASRIHD